LGRGRRAGEQASDEYLLQGGGDMYKPTNQQTKKKKNTKKCNELEKKNEN